jgi:hypothetical protein
MTPGASRKLEDDAESIFTTMTIQIYLPYGERLCADASAGMTVSDRIDRVGDTAGWP